MRKMRQIENYVGGMQKAKIIAMPCYQTPK